LLENPNCPLEDILNDNQILDELKLNDENFFS
jgi:hypothetical protein